jgi:hypothetical protein
MLASVPTELTGTRVAAIAGAMGQGAGLAVWHGWRDTTLTEGGAMLSQPFGGAVEYVPAGAGAASARWSMMAARRSLVLPLQPSGERAGTAVLLGGVSAPGAMESVVSAPFAHSPATMTARASQLASVGAIELYPSSGAAPLGRYTKAFASGIQAATVLLDFDGDGTMELAVAERTETFDSRAADVPAACKIIGTTASGDGGVTRTNLSVGARGIVHVYKLVGGQFVERWRAVSRSETRPLVAGAPTGIQLNQFGFSLSAADVDGDGKDDLVVGRPGGTDSNGAEVVLGRANPTPGAVMTVCNAGDAFTVGPHAANQTAFFGISADGLGDLNGDGCEEVAVGLSRNAATTNPSAAARAGFAIVFGSNTDGARTMPPACAFRRPMTVLVVPDERPFANNVTGDADTRIDDNVDLPGVPGTMGRVFALGAGDLDGDRSSDVVYRTADIAFGPFRGPAVEVLSGRSIALCVAGSCPAPLRDAFYRDGDYMVLGVRTLTAPHRLVAPTTNPIVTRWGASISLADVTGDGAAELFVGSPDDSIGGDFSGAVFGFRGGAGTFTQVSLTDDPWMLAVGDVRERGDFGAALASASNSAAGSWLLVGSPLASRRGAGGELGAGYRWRVEVPR